MPYYMIMFTLFWEQPLDHKSWKIKKNSLKKAWKVITFLPSIITAVGYGFQIILKWRMMR